MIERRLRRARFAGAAALTLGFLVSTASAQQPPATGVAPTPQPTRSATSASITLPPDYVIGVDDLLFVSFWKDDKLSSEVVVRPDGSVSLNLLNDVKAAGLTPAQLTASIRQMATKYYEDPSVAVMVREVRSRKVYIIGNVARPNVYVLTGPMNVMQLIALAGGLQEYAKSKDIRIIRGEENLRFNYNDFVKQKNVKQNLQLLPGDTVVVP